MTFLESAEDPMFFFFAAAINLTVAFGLSELVAGTLASDVLGGKAEAGARAPQAK